MRRPRAVRHPEMPSLATIDEGGVTSALGFTASGVHAGFYEGNDRLDCALVSADVPCPCAALFTRNAFSAAPVDVSRDHLRRVSFGFVRAVLINSGNANALTGETLGKPRVGRAGLPGRRGAGGFHGNHGLAPSRRAVRVRRSSCVQAGVARRRPRCGARHPDLRRAPEGSCRFVPQHRCGVPGLYVHRRRHGERPRDAVGADHRRAAFSCTGVPGA